MRAACAILVLLSCTPVATRSPAADPAPPAASVSTVCPSLERMPPPAIKIVPAADGGLTCFTPQDIVALRRYVAQCSGSIR